MMARRFLYPFLALLLIAAPASAKKVSPEAIAGATTVDVAKAKELFDKGVPFVDVRSNSDWDAGRIPGAKHLELKKVLNEAELAKAVGGKDKEVVLYCNGPSCLRSSDACAKAIGWGFKKVYYFRTGFPSWQEAGHPTE
jgi:rhodanese-related sulfurtransferase